MIDNLLIAVLHQVYVDITLTRWNIAAEKCEFVNFLGLLVKGTMAPSGLKQLCFICIQLKSNAFVPANSVGIQLGQVHLWEALDHLGSLHLF